MPFYRKTQITNQLNENLSLWINSKLLDKGFFRSIKKSESDFTGANLSKFYIDNTNTAYASGMVWKALKPNWVFEGDISLPVGASVINPSGVYINDVFKLPGDAVYPHYFDYKNGRVVFTGTTKVASTAKVEVQYTYKEYEINIPDGEQLFNLHNDFFGNDGITDTVFPLGRITAPAIFIDVEGHNQTPLAVGGGKIAHKNISIHLVANNNFKHFLADIADILAGEQFTTIQLLDVDLIPERITFRGSKAATYQDYKTLNAGTTYLYNLAYFQQIEPIKLLTQRKDWNRIRIDMLVEVRGIQT